MVLSKLKIELFNVRDNDVNPYCRFQSNGRKACENPLIYSQKKGGGDAVFPLIRAPPFLIPGWIHATCLGNKVCGASKEGLTGWKVIGSSNLSQKRLEKR